MNLLIIDDLENVRTVLALGLNLIFNNPNIDQVETVNEAKERLESTVYDLVISDYDLGGFGYGTEIEAYIKQRHPRVKFVLFSSRPPTGYCGMQLSKPYQLQDLKDLKKHLEAMP